MTKPLFILGEAWGEYEQRTSLGFCGPSGIELLRMLHESSLLTLTTIDRQYISDFYRRGDPNCVAAIWELHRDEVYRTNVFNIHPPANKLEWFCAGKAEGIPSYPALLPSRYVRLVFEW